jgi:hypothetical protein
MTRRMVCNPPVFIWLKSNICLLMRSGTTSHLVITVAKAQHSNAVHIWNTSKINIKLILKRERERERQRGSGRQCWQFKGEFIFTVDIRFGRLCSVWGCVSCSLLALIYSFQKVSFVLSAFAVRAWHAKHAFFDFFMLN